MPEKPPHYEEDNQWIAEQIFHHRKKMGLTQTDLATEIGDPRYQKYISDYENGVDHMPISILFALMEALHASPIVMLPPRLYGDERAVFEKFLLLTPEHREAVKFMIDTMLKAEGKD